jgi:hypothetical protein
MGFAVGTDSTFQLKLFWAAVLRRAVFDYVLYKGLGHHRLEWQYAYRFIFTDVEAHYQGDGLSFEDVCHLMNWEPDYIRRLTLRMTRSDIKKMEFNGFREVVGFQEKLVMAAENNARWSENRFAIPKFAPYNYPAKLRQCFVPKTVYRAYERTPPSRVHWLAGAVA